MSGDGPTQSFVERWRPALCRADVVLVLDFHGTRAREMSAFRTAVRSAGGQTVVVKRRQGPALVRGTRLEHAFRDVWHGPTALVLGPVSPALLRRAHDLATGWLGGRGPDGGDRGLRLRKAWLQGRWLEFDELGEIARMPLWPTLPPAIAGSEACVVPLAELADMRARLKPLLEGPPPIRASDEPDDVVTLLGYSGGKLAIIKAVRAVSELGLRDAKHTVEAAPVDIPLRADVTVDAARIRLSDAGGEVAPGAESYIGWSPWPLDAQALFAAASPALRLRPGWALRARAYRDSMGGNGVICALPQESARADGGGWRADSPLAPRLYPGERPFHEAVIGDGSLVSYLHASMLLREVHEFAAEWHGVSWWTHTLVDAPSERDWTWTEFIEPRPPERNATSGDDRGFRRRVFSYRERDFRPRVERVSREPGELQVSFYSESELGSTSLVLHIDRYRDGSYTPLSCKSHVCASAPGGFVF